MAGSRGSRATGYLCSNAFAASMNGFTMSMGSGKMMVEFFSAEISTSVWR